MPHTERATCKKLSIVRDRYLAISSVISALLISRRGLEKRLGLFVKTRTVNALMASKSLSSALGSASRTINRSCNVSSLSIDMQNKIV